MPAIGTQQSELVRLRAENAALRAELQRYALRLADYERVKTRVAELEEDVEPILWLDDNGAEEIDEERALAVLLNARVLACNGNDGDVGMFVLCNDVFAWALADGEDFTLSDLPDLYKAHIANRRWGAVRWCCIHRNEQPQDPIIRAMREDGFWDEVLNALPENLYDAARRKQKLEMDSKK